MIGTIVIINRHPMVNSLRIPRFIIIVRVEISQEIPARTSIAIQSVSLASTFYPIVAVRLTFCNWCSFSSFNIHPDSHPIINLSQNGSITARWLKVLHLWQNHRQAFISHGNWRTTINMNNWNRSAPIALTRNQPIAHFIRGFTSTRILLLQPRNNLLASILAPDPVELTGIYQLTFTRITASIG